MQLMRGSVEDLQESRRCITVPTLYFILRVIVDGTLVSALLVDASTAFHITERKVHTSPIVEVIG